MAPDAAQREFARHGPGVVIIDAAGAPDLLRPLLDDVAQKRRTTNPSMPRMVLICGSGEADLLGAYCDLIDTRVRKPITPDILQPIIDRIVNEYSQPKV